MGPEVTEYGGNAPGSGLYTSLNHVSIIVHAVWTARYWTGHLKSVSGWNSKSATSPSFSLVSRAGRSSVIRDSRRSIRTRLACAERMVVCMVIRCNSRVSRLVVLEWWFSLLGHPRAWTRSAHSYIADLRSSCATIWGLVYQYRRLSHGTQTRIHLHTC
jgi:hypothetical protein